MATNQFFNMGIGPGNNPEYDLADALTIETIQINGFDIYYLPREIVNEDYFYTEDRFARFTENYPIEAYLENVDAFGGDGDFLSKFGLEMRDQATFVISRTRFGQVISGFSGLKRPREGDLIFFPLSGGLFEIMNVEHENPFWQHNRLYCYKLTCELFRYSQEEISTGIEDIDVVEDDNKNVNSALNDKFAKNDQIQDEASGYIPSDFDENNPFGSL